MLTKIVILAYLAVITRQEPYVTAALPYVANYASSYDAHAINHDIRVPVTQAVTAYSPAFAPLTAAIPQAITAYSPGIASYSLAPAAAAPIAPVAPLTAAHVVSPVAPGVSLPVTNPIPAVAPVQARFNPDSAPSEAEPNKPSRSTLLPENPINPAVVFATQFLSRNIASLQSRPQGSRAAPQNVNSQENQAAQQSRVSDVPQEEQRHPAILGATPTGFGLIQRANARFAQLPLRQGNNQIQNADLKSRQPLAAERSAPNAKLVSENEDSESVEINSSNEQVPEGEKVVGRGPIVPARLATLTPNVGFVPSVYTSFVAF